MHSEIIWTPWDGPGMEHLVLRKPEDGGVEVESTVLGMADGRPFTLHYHIECDASWGVRSLVVEAPRGWTRIDIRSDGNGNWTDPGGGMLRELAGCIDVDIMVTPFTNTLPIRRLELAAGESHEIRVVYVSAPSLELSVVKQRYTCLEPGARYHYESLRDGESVFQADLPVDDDGLVLDYPGRFRRVAVQQDANH